MGVLQVRLLSKKCWVCVITLITDHGITLGYSANLYSICSLKLLSVVVMDLSTLGRISSISLPVPFLTSSLSPPLHPAKGQPQIHPILQSVFKRRQQQPCYLTPKAVKLKNPRPCLPTNLHLKSRQHIWELVPLTSGEPFYQ